MGLCDLHVHRVVLIYWTCVCIVSLLARFHTNWSGPFFCLTASHSQAPLDNECFMEHTDHLNRQEQFMRELQALVNKYFVPTMNELRSEKLTPKKRKEIAQKAARARWGKKPDVNP